MKNKKILIPILSAGLAGIIGLSAFILMTPDDQQTSTSGSLKQAIFSNDVSSDSSSSQGYIISRKDVDVSSWYEIQKDNKISNFRQLYGYKRQQPCNFYEFDYGGETFDIQGLADAPIKYGTYNEAAVIQAGDYYQIQLYKIANSSTTKIINPYDDNKTLKEKYKSLCKEYNDECDKKAKEDGLDIYDDRADGGIMNFSPMQKFIEENSLQYEINIYDSSSITQVLRLCYDIPDEYGYSASRATNNLIYGRTGSIKKIKDIGDYAHNEYYLLFSSKGVYAVNIFYTDYLTQEPDNNYSNLDAPTVFDYVVPKCTDKDYYMATSKKSGYSDGSDYEERKFNSEIIQKKFSDKDILSVDTYKSTKNGRIYIENGSVGDESSKAEGIATNG